jgi:hypothetical protein
MVMAISAAVKVGYIDLEPAGDASSQACSNRIGFSVGQPEDKVAYISRIARISVGEFEPQADFPSKNEDAMQK